MKIMIDSKQAFVGNIYLKFFISWAGMFISNLFYFSWKKSFSQMTPFIDAIMALNLFQSKVT